MTPAIHQIVAGFVEGDAISDLALRLRDIFRAWGHEAEIFCPRRHISPKMRPLALDLAEHRARYHRGDLTLLHFSIGSETVNRFRELATPRILIYHNITPGRYYRSVYDEREALLDQGRRELSTLAPLPDLSLADSAFNASELEASGFR
ncbi:MAG: hypothetical protein NT045_00620, partial [Candidatus Aureabacteria bacterium]|nr:hypothetical protein [Candidatus Auribacterota bacterium]